MQARKSVSLLVLPVVMAMAAFSAQAADGLSSPQPAAQAAAAGDRPAASADTSVSVASATTSTATTGTRSTTSSATASQPAQQDGFGVAMTSEQLDAYRGGDALVGQNNLTGTVSDNTAYKVSTGSNAITGGSFASSSGLPTVIQNTGANVLIQNATVLNVHFGD
ncbi:hypothetical protein [Paraburkholderia sp. BL10I2N1]|uniref:hypothetical protein n=1 Tax=Paraburkholderia sp. BL10I2N1 TaxID=1938796 RepID=UPI00105BBF70|nr:hypothetical protein [Paraburkholderia sp. BL10I2N1]TDN63716.1 hypothetical protein B0G77_7396 [Paraburkholderia sp. BL10I2N1]